jgi:hypothetical protein
MNTKPTPLSEEEIKDAIGYVYEIGVAKIVRRLILAWIHERAMKEKAEFMCLILSQPLGTRKSLQNKPQMTWTDADWLATVKERVGWVDDKH